ncbi:hypothetical protein ACFVZM_08675 [Streptomyces sioyaensis]|uniref:hypothetical protein n=1 Tax=Streptomyces sioyaensis TaxID=67364 RepID=UPI0036C35224
MSADRVPSAGSRLALRAEEYIPVKAAMAVRRRLRRSCDVPVKAARIVNDYVFRLYFPANRMPLHQRFRCAPLILLVEYLVYKVDAVSEGAKRVDLDVVRDHDEDYLTLHKYKAKFEKILRRMHAYNWSVAHQMEMAEEYVRLENKVTSNRLVAHAEVIRLAELRPSDVRLLHGMTFALRRRPCDEDLLNLLWPVEVLADIGNDLAHYPDDLANGQFNTYAMFVELYGAGAPERIRAEIARYEGMFLAELKKFPRVRQADLKALCARRYRRLTAAIPEPLPQTGYMSVQKEQP